MTWDTHPFLIWTRGTPPLPIPRHQGAYTAAAVQMANVVFRVFMSNWVAIVREAPFVR